LLLGALDAAARLGPVFPLFTPKLVDGVWGCDCPDTYKTRDDCSPGKHPRTRNGSKDASRDPSQITRWWTMFPTANIALVLTDDLLDVGPDDIGWLSEFQARGLPPTFTFVSSGPGHMHYLYRRPAGCPPWRICKQHEYDIMSSGYVVIPPSMHLSGVAYLLADPRDPVAAPDWAVELLLEAATRPKVAAVASGTNIASGDELERIIAAIDPSVWTGVRFDDRSSSLHAIAGDAAKAGANFETLYAIVAERDVSLGFFKYANRTPEQAHHAYLMLAQGALAKNPGDLHGRIGEGQPFSSSRSGDSQRQRGTGNRFAELEWLTAADLRNLTVEDAVWYAEGFLAEGVLTEVDGYAKKAGKTTFALAMVACLLESAPFLERPTSYSSVVYLTEQGTASFRRAFERSGLLGRQQNDVYVLSWHSARKSKLKWPEIVEAAVIKCKEAGSRILIVDTMSQWTDMRGDQENQSGAMAEMMRPVQAAAADDLAVLVLRHDKKAGGEVGKSARGSSFAAGAVDIIVQLEKLPQSANGSANQRVLRAESRFEETPAEMVIELREALPNSYKVVSQSVGELVNEKHQMQILAMLPLTEENAWPTKRIQDELGIRRQTVLGILNLMHDKGYIRRVEQKGGFAYWQEPLNRDD
jgi:Mn-dependent DtxR family transcriptional regulator